MQRRTFMKLLGMASVLPRVLPPLRQMPSTAGAMSAERLLTVADFNRIRASFKAASTPYGSPPVGTPRKWRRYYALQPGDTELRYRDVETE